MSHYLWHATGRDADTASHGVVAGVQLWFASVPHVTMRAMPTTYNARGRKPDAASKSGQIRELLKTGMNAGDIAKQLKCTPALVYNVRARLGAAPKRGPGRPPKASASTGMDGLEGILAAVKNSERDRAAMRAALEKIQGVIAGVLA